MKPAPLVLLTAVLCVLLSCKKSGDFSYAHNPDLTDGKWKLIEAGYTDTVMPTEQKISYSAGIYLDFDEKGGFSAKINESTSGGEWHYLEQYTSLFLLNRTGQAVDNDNYRIELLTEHSLVLLAYKHAGIAEKRLYFEK